MFSYTLTDNDKNSFQDLENLLSPTQIQLSLKPKTLSDFFAISGIYIKFETFWKER